MGEAVPLPPDWDSGQTEVLAVTPTSTIYRIFSRDGATKIAKCLTPLGVKHESLGVDYLSWRQGRGAVDVLDVEGDAILLEDGGSKTLYKHRQDVGDAATLETLGEIVATLLAEQQQPPSDFLPLEQHLEFLFLRCTMSGPKADMDLFENAAGLARKLLGSCDTQMPLHGDLHHENLLLSNRGWLAIDPFGLVGDPAYESANLFSNPRDDVETITRSGRIVALAKAVSSHTGQDESRLIGWGMVHACLSAAWSDIDEPQSGVKRFRANRMACARACQSVLSVA